MRSIARPYAKAVLSVAGSTERATMVRDQLAELLRLTREVPALAAAIANPALPAEAKRSAVDRVVAGLGFDPLTRRLLGALAQRNRLSRLDQVVDRLSESLNERLGIAVAEVQTAEPLGDEERRELQQVLERRVGKRLQMRLQVQPDLLAGFVARVESQLFDGSLRGQLDRLAKELAEA